MRGHQFVQRLEGYRDVRSILSAMKNIALMELHALAGLLENQRRAMATIDRAAADFLCFHSPPGGNAPPRPVLIAIGSERGFCGDFNDALVAPVHAAVAGGDRVLAVGARLVERLEGFAGEAVLGGAGVAEELPAVLEQVLAWLERAQRAADGPLAVRALHHEPGAGALQTRIVAPLPTPQRPQRPHPTPPRLMLAPEVFYAGLLDQALLLALQEAFSESLIAENRSRLEHMEGALRRLDELTAALGRRMNASRQEEITEEIEVMLLSEVALSNGSAEAPAVL